MPAFYLAGEGCARARSTKEAVGGCLSGTDDPLRFRDGLEPLSALPWRGKCPSGMRSYADAHPNERRQEAEDKAAAVFSVLLDGGGEAGWHALKPSVGQQGPRI